MNTTQGQRRTSFQRTSSQRTGFQRAGMIKLVALGATALIATSMIGCASSGKSIIKGRVIAGVVGQSVSASPGDLRFEEPGVPDALVTIMTKSGNASRGRGVYTKVTSDQYGNFELSFAGGQYPRDSVQVKVQGEGFYTSRSQTFLPSEGDQILCVVITRPGYVIPEPDKPEAKK